MTGREIVEFTNVIRSVYTFDEFSTFLLGLNRTFLHYVRRDVPFPKQVEEFVAAANSEGWISQLVLAVLHDRPNNQHVKDFVAQRPYWDPTKHPQLAHPADTLRIFGGRSFIARDVLRDALKRMDDPTERKVLHVTSAHRKVGKTYSKDLVDFVSKSLPPSVTAYVDLDAEKYDPITLAKKLAKEMRLNPDLIPRETTEQAARSNQELVELLTTPATNSAPTTWIVLDGFREQIPTEPIQDFIAQLAKRVQSTEEFRLVLLNYPPCLPIAVNGFTLKDPVEPLTRQELETHFAKVHWEKHRANPSQEDLSEYLSGLAQLLTQFKNENPDLVDDQILVNIAVTTVADEIEGVP